MRSSSCVLLLALVAAAVCAVSAQPDQPRRQINVNFNGLFAGAGAAGLAPTENLVAASTDASCSPPAVEQTEVNVNFDGMLNAFSQACQLNAQQLAAHCALHTFDSAADLSPYVSTMPGLCRNTGERFRDIACVRPGGTVDVQLALRNTGSGTWPASNFVLQLLVEDGTFPAWNGSQQLKMIKDTPPGQTAHFSGLLRAPEFPGRFDLSWQLTGACGSIGRPIHALVEITCSDGVFCNGVERYIDGKCVAAKHPPCDDFVVCTQDTCDEDAQRCSRVMLTTNEWDPIQKKTVACSSVARCGGPGTENCTPNCWGKACGGDGCGGVCGDLGGLCSNRESCNIYGECIVNQAEGSCDNAYRLLQDGVAFGGRHIFDLDTSLGAQATTATCNPTATAAQIMVKFTVPNDGKEWHVDARLSNGWDAISSTLDTVLELREGRCYDPIENEPAFFLDGPNQNVWCSDDAAPPGGVGSRVVAPLKNNHTYWFVAGGYNSVTVGPATLTVTFVHGYTPSCLSRYCGPDGGGGNCGDCSEGTRCDEFLRCSPAPSSEFCTVDRCKSTADEGGPDRVCGSDGCGGFCGNLTNGACPDGQLCAHGDGQCKSGQVCDHLHPRCSQCTETQFCGSDCQCYDLDAVLPDLVLDVERLSDSLLLDHVEFDNITCAWHEGCVSGTGVRKLLRFDTTTINQGVGDLRLADPALAPHEFSWALCHNHYHFEGYAEYRLTTLDGDLVARGHKQGYCMQDSNQQENLPGPNVHCRPQTTCEVPGISAGWSDVYGNDIDCQWIDVTDVPAGRYLLRIELNVLRKFVETTTENNVGIIEVVIP